MVSEPVELTLRHCGRIDKAEGPEGATAIAIGVDVLERPPEALCERLAGRRLFVLTAPHLRRLHGDRLTPLLAGAVATEWIEQPDGEAAKTVATAEKIWQRLLDLEGKRDSVLVALGGGSIGDLGGFVAASFLRGIDFVQVPTSLLAQVDAAIGGKTGVNLPAAKNSVGAFHHPLAVLADTRLLTTLPRADLRSGMLEVVKAALILAPELIDLLESQLDRLLEPGAEVPETLQALASVVARATAAKVAVVEEDPFERGRRKLLNFGHTLGHALESVLTDDGGSQLRHGDAVGYGMLFALRLAAQRGLGSQAVDRATRLIRRCGLPPLPEVTVSELMARIYRDKKARESGLTWVLPRSLGTGELVEGLESAWILDELTGFLESERDS